MIITGEASENKKGGVFTAMERIVYCYSRGCSDPVMGLAASEEGGIPVCCEGIVPSVAVLGRKGGFYGEDELGCIDIPPTDCKCGNHVIVGESISGQDIVTRARAGDIYVLLKETKKS